MAIDIQARRPVFDNLSAGLSGPAIKPIALRMVWELCHAVSVPVVGLGGIACANDALEFLMAGATALQVGSATFSHPNTMIEIINGIESYMHSYKLSAVGEISLEKRVG
jgi:dihydroorotate dehydrogenase (NAD+) catalytic subunit